MTLIEIWLRWRSKTWEPNRSEGYVHLHRTQCRRSSGLRLAPITVGWRNVDNPDAARAFVKELSKRKVSAAHPGRLPGPLDYWGTWVLLMVPRSPAKSPNALAITVPDAGWLFTTA